MPHINDAFPSTYLKASDLKGATVTVTIDKVTFEPVGTDRDMKAIVYFVGKTKGVVLNKTNSRKIVEIAGSPLTEDWPGVVIALYPTETQFAGEMVECIRMKAVGRSPAARVTAIPKTQAALPVIQIQDEEIPF